MMVEYIKKRIKAYEGVIANIVNNDTNSRERIATYKSIIGELNALLKFHSIHN